MPASDAAGRGVSVGAPVDVGLLGLQEGDLCFCDGAGVSPDQVHSHANPQKREAAPVQFSPRSPVNAEGRGLHPAASCSPLPAPWFR